MFKIDFLARFKSFLGLNENNQQKKQLFNFSWEIEVFNTSSKSVAGELFLPLPLELPSQKIIREPAFAPAADKITAEEIYRNRYAAWNVALQPGEKKSFLCQFQAEISPVNFLPDKKFLLNDYAPVKSENEIWLSANRFIQSENQEIYKIAEKISAEEKNVLLILKKLNAYVINRLKYGQPILGLYSATDALKKDVIDCGGFASLLVSFCLSLGIPARIVSGFWAGYPDNAMHVWVEIKMPDDSWIPADPTVENLRVLGRTKKTGQLGFVGSDRIIFSQGCDLEINTREGKVKIDILQNPFYKGAQEEKINPRTHRLSQQMYGESIVGVGVKIKHNLKTESVII